MKRTRNLLACLALSASLIVSFTGLSDSCRLCSRQSSIWQTYRDTQARILRYYVDVRMVYELSRLREPRPGATVPAESNDAR